MSAPAGPATTPAGVAGLLRPELQGASPYGAPQLDLPVQLNTNESSYGVPAAVVTAMLDALAAELPRLNRYPDREARALRSALAGYLTERSGVAVRAEQVWAANGSNEVLQHLFQAFGGPGRTALGFTPSYSMHQLIATTLGTRWVDGRRDPVDFTMTVADAADQAREIDPEVVVLCSPNNPTGTALPFETIEAVLEAAPRALVVVDEAYGEYARPGTRSAVALLTAHDRLVVTRTLSKALSLAGGRLGYLAADPAVGDALRLVRLPYHLSGPTQVLARVALEHADDLLAGVRATIAQRDRMVTELAAMGLRPVPSDANFVLVGGLRDAPAAWQALVDDGVLVRDVGIPHHLRLTAGTEEETDRLLDAVRRLLPEHALADPATSRPTAPEETP